MAEKIVSPGVFTRENDLSFLSQGIGEIGAAIIGPFHKGPAFVPTVVNTQSEFEEILTNIDLVYDFHIFKFDNKNSVYKIIFNGSPDYFLKIMNNINYQFDTQNQVWILK